MLKRVDWTVLNAIVTLLVTAMLLLLFSTQL